MTTPSQGRYGGDARLARLLADAACGLGVADVKTMIAGVLAAPESHDGGAWLSLFAPGADSELAAELRALKTELAARCEDGLRAGPPAPAWRLAALRRELRRSRLDGFVVPQADEHQGEFTPRRARRLQWLTGFSGSAGVAVILAHKAAIFVDGRYTLQVENQVDVRDWERHHLIERPFDAWVAAELAGGRLGYDPWLHTPAGVRRWAAASARAGADLTACETNPIDTVWSNRPPPPVTPIVAHGVALSGRESADKIAEICSILRRDGEDAAVLSDPASIAWLLNLRGGDVPNTPLALGFAIVEASGGVCFYTDPRRLGPAVKSGLPAAVTVLPRDALAAACDRIAAGAKVRLDADTVPVWFADRIRKAGGTPVESSDPCALPKACKNAVEIAGARAAHIRDGVALTRFLAWLDASTRPGTNAALDETAAADELDRCRAASGEGYRGPSFDTISGSGPNSAVVHYRATSKTSRRLKQGDLYLVDSGGQYVDGTTDVTRTIAVGEPDDDHRKHFTAVLKGHIALATARFPEGTTGAQLDALARAPLWAIGVDFDHGTGHGVGHYLGVHEGPQSISKAHGDTAFRPGMICSNEPGYYRAGAWGIRIENLVVVEKDDGLDGERPMLRLATLTKAPIDRRLIAVDALGEAEIRWLDAYHADVRETLAPLLDAKTAAWLAEATRPLRDAA